MKKRETFLILFVELKLLQHSAPHLISYGNGTISANHLAMSSTIFPTTAAAASSNVVTPTIDELEQAAFYAQEQAGVHDGQQQQVLLQHSEYHHHSSNDAPPSLSTLESMVDAALPSSASFYSPASLDVEGTSSLEENYYDTNMMCIGEKNFASFASVAALAAPSPQEFIAIQEHSSPLPLQSKEDAMEAANILCQFKNNVVQSQSSCKSNTSNSSSMDCSPPPAPTDAMADIVDMAVEMLTGQTCAELYEQDGEEEDGIAPLDSTQFPPQDKSITYTNTSSVAAPAKKKKKAAALPPLPLPSSESFHHPNRLATIDDHEEVNKLHQYVRSDLLEIFVVPKVDSSNADSDSSEDEDNGDNDSSDSSDDEENVPIASLTKKKSNANAAPTTTRRLVTRRRSISISSNSTTSNSIANRHYPGRVGIRCVHCACIRNKSTSKSAFFPLRLKNIYREVCAWQRIHFKKCTHVPRSVRERYDYCKRIDTSRGKVRYWESSAKKVGLVNNPNRVSFIIEF